jgi:hypothetical protein
MDDGGAAADSEDRAAVGDGDVVGAETAGATAIGGAGSGADAVPATGWAGEGAEPPHATHASSDSAIPKERMRFLLPQQLACAGDDGAER